MRRRFQGPEVGHPKFQRALFGRVVWNCAGFAYTQPSASSRGRTGGMPQFPCVLFVNNFVI